jgi:GNAT superfamily N-acetyltransferase
MDITFRTLSPDFLRERERDLMRIASDQPDEYWTLQNFLIELPKKWLLSFGVFQDADFSGYVIASAKSPESIHVHHFMLRADRRGKGIGARMMAEAEVRCRAAGASRLTLKVKQSNQAAVQFYQKAGFLLSEEAQDYLCLHKPLRQSLVAIHQPNYLPWLGYFNKIARAEYFVFLDNVQFTKGGYTNRVQILSPKGPRWLTIPVAVHLGDPIDRVTPVNSSWPQSHVDNLYAAYHEAPAFQSAWPDIKGLLLSVSGSNLATVNIGLIKGLCERLHLPSIFRCASELSLTAQADDRLIEIVSLVAPGGKYLSGKGGAKYQDPAKFASAGLGFEYLEFVHPEYPQGAHLGRSDFVTGLSVLDAVFHLGWEKTTQLVTWGNH